MDFLPWLLFILPITSAIVIHFGLAKKAATIGSYVGTAATGGALLIAILLLGKTEAPEPWSWININHGETHVLNINIGITLDKLSTGMMLIVTGIGFLVHVFSLGYMKSDSAKGRYFGNLSLFMFSMTGIVLADNLIMTFIFWELVGLSSYLLIGHWYEKHSAGDAAKKAFLTNRIGDFGFMIGILMLFTGLATTGGAGTFDFELMKSTSVTMSNWSFGMAIFFIFMGAMGKSAQAPLHVWLPDAMEGPTPVSALIHAATMVAAGVYMMARVFMSLPIDFTALQNLWSMEVIAWIGGITSLLAALMATQQNDIKKILAYSTLSQLGYMVMAVGLANPDAGMFHLYTHAWFKALLFLGSGAIIYACHHDQDIWNMGGLLKRMPLTSITFIVGTACLIAIPFTSGFFSKELILVTALEKNVILFGIAVLVAALTTFYMLRLVFVAILGDAKHKHSEDAKEVSPIMLAPLILLAVVALISPWLNIIPSAEGFKAPTEIHINTPTICSLVALLAGAAGAFVLYFNKTKDPLNIKLFANKFYIDELYEKIVKIGQDFVAALVYFFDEFFINGLLVGGTSRSAEGIGNIFRNKIQNGNLQGYAIVFGLGIAITIFITVFL